MNPTSSEFAIATASRAGREHERCGRNNQDAVAVRRSATSWVLVVCDGCSAGRASEVGANLMAQVFANALIEASEPNESAMNHAVARTLEMLGSLLPQIGPSAQRVDTLHHFLLSTLIAAHIGQRQAQIAAFGDGFVGVDDELVQLESPNDTPEYLAYALYDQRPPRATFQRTLERDAFEFLLLATDGASSLLRSAEANPLCRPAAADRLSLARLRADSLFLDNPSWLQRQLRAHRPAPLDDATLAIAGRPSLHRSEIGRELE
ncbi:MAG: protein phosphatase 2C domain-containing protein [Myxococcales bacterium]|nr:protein phosphatase 2C domain-containing protein [Myxococcales bacterium]